MANKERGFKRSPYYYDMRYGLRRPLSEMNWQRGVLSVEQDQRVIGDREAEIARVLKQPTQEMQPDDKLKTPGLMQAGDDIIFNIG